MNTNQVWQCMLEDILLHGDNVVCRTHAIMEKLGYKSMISMETPLITLSTRKLGYRFACAEAAWILSGDNKVETIKPFSAMIDKFSDDRETFFGAYGPKIMDQLEYINRALAKDIYSRQAVLTIWREKPPVSNDIPCTISIQFLVRDNEQGEKELHLFDCMRSSDSWLGVPYDWFTFSMVGAYFCLYFRNTTGIKLKLGKLHFYSGSQHLYKESFGYNLEQVHDVVQSFGVDFQYSPLDPHEFESPSEFVSHLWLLARIKEGGVNRKWLRELSEFWGKKNNG